MSLRLGLVALCLLSAAAPLVGQKKPAKPGQDPSGQDPAAEDPVLASDIQAFTSWLEDYKKGAFRLVKEGRTDEEAIARVDALMQKMAKWNTLTAARLLFVAASVEPMPPGAHTATEMLDFHRELQPWRVRELAAAQLRTMTGEGILPWLLGMLKAKGIRGKEGNEDQRNAAAALRVLGGHTSLEAHLALLEACQAMPSELRVKAVDAMAKTASLELVPTLLELLRDKEPNVRIAAASALGSALQPHVDETLGKEPTGEVLALRDQVFGKLEELLVRDKVWQVRNAASFALANCKCKAAIPVLIRGLDAELGRKKDPWAMDVRLHRLLEGLTGQVVVQGSIAPWKEFWAKEGPGFKVQPKLAAGEAPPEADKYEKFFKIDVESDRVLFVLDFSGSMAEPITLQARTTAAPAGQTTTKAALVVSELEKLIMSLPDGTLINLVVFSDEVRVWRQEGNRPALIKLDDATRDDLVANFLRNLRPSGATNLYGALDKALEFSGRGIHDKYYDIAFDTLYVISDGAPTAGEITDKDEIRRRVRETNRLRRIAINCITFGDKNDTDFLRPMAEENGGRHVHIE
ncbi:MAG: HEAT repeat domain-containing protein [Planctomycetes bacterium]|nr:HEAT repeat domain-containing protein [Planctomycetota bacterium]MCB9884238.1 HEAT repeat domain-containing protein [Planctomycetota bacterium]